MVLTRLMPSSTSLQDLPDTPPAVRARRYLALVAQGVQAGGGEIQRVVDLVDDAGAHAAQRRQLLGLHQLGLGFLELLDGGLEDLVLLGQLALVLVGLHRGS